MTEQQAADDVVLLDTQVPEVFFYNKQVAARCVDVTPDRERSGEQTWTSRWKLQSGRTKHEGCKQTVIEEGDKTSESADFDTPGLGGPPRDTGAAAAEPPGFSLSKALKLLVVRSESSVLFLPPHMKPSDATLLGSYQKLALTLLLPVCLCCICSNTAVCVCLLC